MEPQEFGRIDPGKDVCDLDGNKIGTVGKIYRRDPVAATAPATLATPGATARAEGVLELKTGLFGLGKHLYIPLTEIRDVTQEGVFLAHTRDAIDQSQWETKPEWVDEAEPAASMTAADLGSTSVAAPTTTMQPAQDVTRPSGTTPETVQADTLSAAAGTTETWEQAMPRFRARWHERYGASGASWSTYEPRYRYAWEMSHRPEYRGRSWISVQPEFRRDWEVRFPESEWDIAADSVRDAWEHTQTGAPA